MLPKRVWRRKTRLATAFLFASLLVSTGCVVGPDFHGVPTKPLSFNFLNSPASEPWQSPHLPDRPSWVRFEDQNLSQLIDSALVESPNVKELHWRVCEAAAIVSVVSGQRNPFAEAGATYERRKRSEKAQPFVGPNGDPFDFFSTGINSQWEIDIVGRIRRETQAAHADYQSTIADLNDVRRLLVGEIARTYVRVRLYQDLQRTSQANLAIQSKALESVEARIEAGKVGKLDLIQLQSRLRLTESDLPLFNEQLKIALNQLAVLVGTTPNRQFLEIVGYGPQLNAPLIGRGVPADLIRYRPDMRRSEQEVAAETARVGVATAELYPKLNLLGTISIDSRNVSSLISPESLAFTFGPSMAWNILSLGRIEKSIEAQKARVQQAIQRYQQTLLTAVVEVENSLASYHENSRRSKVLLAAVDKASEAVELAEDQYRADRASLERVVSNQRRLLQASILLAETRAAMATASVDLIQATGVGWGGPGSVGQTNVIVNTAQGGVPMPSTSSVPMPPNYIPTPVASPKPAARPTTGSLPYKAPAQPSLDEPVEGDSDGVTELLPPPKRSSQPTTPQIPTLPRPVEPALPSINPAPSKVPAPSILIPADDPDVSTIQSLPIPWAISQRAIETLPSIDSVPDSSTEPVLKIAKTKKSEGKWQGFRPDPKRDWYAAPRLEKPRN